MHAIMTSKQHRPKFNIRFEFGGHALEDFPAFRTRFEREKSKPDALSPEFQCLLLSERRKITEDFKAAQLMLGDLEEGNRKHLLERNAASIQAFDGSGRVSSDFGVLEMNLALEKNIVFFPLEAHDRDLTSIVHSSLDRYEHERRLARTKLAAADVPGIVQNTVEPLLLAMRDEAASLKKHEESIFGNIGTYFEELLAFFPELSDKREINILSHFGTRHRDGVLDLAERTPGKIKCVSFSESFSSAWWDWKAEGEQTIYSLRFGKFPKKRKLFADLLSISGNLNLSDGKTSVTEYLLSNKRRTLKTIQEVLEKNRSDIVP